MIHVFVGCAANNEDLESQMVLEASMRRYASEPVTIHWMRLSRRADSTWYSIHRRAGWQTDLWSTPFSGFRWAVPHVALREGADIAVYSDSDVIFRADIAELARQQFQPGKVIIAKATGPDSWRFCVSLWNVPAALKMLPAYSVLQMRDTHRRLIEKFRGARFVQSFAGDWNNIDGEDRGLEGVKALHYSSEAHQPHLARAIPRLAREGSRHWFDGEVKRHWRRDVIDLFEEEYGLALAEGYKLEQYINPEPFGPYVKKSERNYGSHRWAR